MTGKSVGVHLSALRKVFFHDCQTVREPSEGLSSSRTTDQAAQSVVGKVYCIDCLDRDERLTASQAKCTLKLKCIAVACQITLDRSTRGGENGPSLCLKSSLF
jgi:hypothetical protein